MHKNEGSSHSFESLLHVGKKVSFVLDTSRHSNEVVIDTKHFSVLSRYRTVSHDSWVFDKRLNTTKRFSQGDNLECSEESVSLLKTTLNEERDHTTESTHLLLSNVVLGMALEAGVDNLLDLGMRFKHLSNSHSIAGRSLNSNTESFSTSQTNPAVERRSTSSNGLHGEVKSLVKFKIVKAESTTNDIGVTTEVLGSRVHNDISTKLGRALPHRSSESVINNKDDTSSLKSVGNGLNVENLQSRVGGSLKPDNLGVLLEAFLEHLDVREIRHSEFKTKVGTNNLLEVSLGTTVNVINAKNMVSRLEDVHDSDSSTHTR
mmetsp:Transcript_103026/g.142525  ORF Transcript_103026/g.142525 Transcript_103026/m.142525 type:complete len:318 (+) Transcript_103026:33-986(+)